MLCSGLKLRVDDNLPDAHPVRGRLAWVVRRWLDSRSGFHRLRDFLPERDAPTAAADVVASEGEKPAGRGDAMTIPGRMTEGEWLDAIDPAAMLDFLRDSGRAGDRKLRLFAVACCRRIWDFLLDNRSRLALEVSEQYADGLALGEQLGAAWEAAMAAARALGHPPAFAAACVAGSADPSTRTSWDAARAMASSGTPAWDASKTTEFLQERAAQAGLLRDLIANPFRPPPGIEPAWLAWQDGLVVKLALAAYEQRLLPSGELDTARLAVLCDALEEAGCPPGHELLLHLRGPGPHVRGCFALDLLLGRD
jgi:hypothetical protein